METKKILCIEDEDIMSNFIVEGLRDEGRTIICACDGREGIDLFRSHCPDLVLLDIGLPGMSGIEVLSILRKESPDLPVIIVSGLDNQENAIEALRLGAWDFITKPFKLVVLRHAVAMALDRAELLCEKKRFFERLEQEIVVRRQTEEDLRQSQNRYRCITEAITSYIYHVREENGLVVETVHSSSCEAVTGYRPVDFVADPFLWLNMVPSEERNLVREKVFAMLTDDKPLPIEHRIVRKDGAIRWVSKTLVIHYDVDGRRTAFDGVVCDITERKDAELRLQEARTALELRVQERTAELRRANDSLLQEITERKSVEAALVIAKQVAEAANCSKSSFLAAMSHEIRTPMNAIIGMIDLVLDMELDQRPRHYLQMVKDSASSLLAILNDILDVSKIEAGQLFLDQYPFDLEETMAGVVQTLAMQAHGKGLELLCHFPAHVPTSLVGDALRLRQVLMNLVGNSVKFTQSGHILVKVEIDARDTMEVLLHFQVSDTGVGIPADRHQRIFERFSQGDNVITRRYGGTGLGLTICRMLVDLMDGQIWVESEPGNGSNFHFTARFQLGLPVQPEPCLPNRDPAAIPVLVAGSNAIGLEILKAMFEDWGFPVETALSGQKTLVRLSEAESQNRPYGLLVVDQSIDPMTGLGPPEIFARENNRARPPVILLIPYVTSLQNHERYRELEACFCLTKPVVRSELRKLLRKALDRAALGKHLSEKQVRTMAGQPGQSFHLLLVDDNLFNQELAGAVLEKAGHSVVMACSGLEALERLALEKFQGILMDLEMPEMDGLTTTGIIRCLERGEEVFLDGHNELVRQLRVRLAGGHIPIVAMTAHAMSNDRQRCLIAGMDDYISKPFKPANVLDILQRLAGVMPQRRMEDHESIAPVELPGTQDLCSQIRRHLMTKYEMKEDWVEQMLPKMKVHLAMLLNETEQALANGDWAMLTLKAHSMKGIFGHLGLHEKAHFAQRLEQIEKRQGETVLQALQEQIQVLRRDLAPMLTEQ